MKVLKKSFILFCVVFTIGTILSSSVQLMMGVPEDTNVHILDRAVLTMLGSFIVVFVTQYHFKNRVYKFFVPYVIFIVLALGYVWICGFWQELHPNAYRDVFLNDTIAYIVVYGVIEVYECIKRRTQERKNGE